MRTCRLRRGFTLIELLVVISIILLLASILLPALSAARQSGQAAACAMHLRTFGTAFEMYGSNDSALGARTSGAFDHLRDGDVRKFGWVADVINLKVGNPGNMLCPSNRFTVNEKVGDYTGAVSTGSPNPNRPHPIPVVPVGVQSEEFWAKGYNTNYATSWHFSRGDPTAADGFGINGDPSDPSKSPLDGDGPLNLKHLGMTDASADRIVIMGDARVGNSSDSSVDSSYAQTVNTFAGQNVVNVGDFTLESFTDGMSVDYASVTGNPGNGHEFNDIAPLHRPKTGDYVGGFANVLFADGHVSAVYDSAGETGDSPDGFLGPYRASSGSFSINNAAFREIYKSMWYKRLRPRPSAGGGSNEG